jgi:diadenosine tetraphosphate (Ap4A) HIT family hydrolase
MNASTERPTCELCLQDGGLLVWRDPHWRVVRVEDEAFAAYYRVICNHHVAEFSDLLAPERERCMQLVVAVERVLREQLSPTKVNLASLGNVTPHMHWHVIARFEWDSHYPQPVWGREQRVADAARMSGLRGMLADADAALMQALKAL